MRHLAPDTVSVIIDVAHMAQRLCFVLGQVNNHTLFVLNSTPSISEAEKDQFLQRQANERQAAVTDTLVRLDQMYPEYGIHVQENSDGLRLNITGPNKACVSLSINVNSGMLQYFNVYHIGTRGIRYTLWEMPVDMHGVNAFNVTYLMLAS